MIRHQIDRRLWWGLGVLTVFAFAILAACTSETVVPTAIVIEKQVIVEKEVPVEVVKQVIVEVEKQVIVEKEVPVVREVEKQVVVEKEVRVVQTVIVEREVVRVVEKEVVREVLVTARSTGFPVAGSQLIVAVNDVGPSIYHRGTIIPSPHWGNAIVLGIGETMTDYDLRNDDPYSPMIAASWEFEEVDGVDGVTWHIQQGVPYHDPAYGTVKAEDIHWGLEESRRGKYFAIAYWDADFKDMRVLDEHTLRWDWATGPNLRWSFLTRHDTRAGWASPKKYFDDEGEDAVNRRPIGTGPYKLIEHVANDIIVLEGVKNHWRINPGFESVRVIEVPEQSTRIAMFKSGQADVVKVAMPFLDQVKDLPGVRLQVGHGVDWKLGTNIVFGGNWLTFTEEDGSPATSQTPLVTENPWVGDPAVPGSMENAKKVRLAMSLAVDREALNDVMLAGLGCLSFVYGVDTCHNRWEARWGHEYDPERAKTLLAEAGYSEGFEFTFWAPTGRDPTYQELCQAVWPMWEEIGLKVNVDASDMNIRLPQIRRGDPEFGMKDVFCFSYAGSLATPLAFTDVIPDATYGIGTQTNVGFDYPEARDYSSRLFSLFDEEEAWSGPIRDYMTSMSHLGYMWTFNTVAWQDPWAVGPGVGDFEFIMHGVNIPELESLRPAAE